MLYVEIWGGERGGGGARTRLLINELMLLMWGFPNHYLLAHLLIIYRRFCLNVEIMDGMYLNVGQKPYWIS